MLLQRQDDVDIHIKEKEINVVVFKDDDQYTAYCADLDLATAQDSPEELLKISSLQYENMLKTI